MIGSDEEAGDSNIIVTANRVDSRVQDVPVSVTAAISNDMTDGYGPGEYAIRRAPAGEYQVRVNGFDADRINPNGPGHVLIRLIRDFARPGVRQTLVDAGLSFQKGRNRDEEDGARPLATLQVERK